MRRINMPRPKGSKNKSSLTIAERLEKANAEYDELYSQLKQKKAELKTLTEQIENEKKKTLLDAIEKSGKSPDEILNLILSQSQE